MRRRSFSEKYKGDGTRYGPLFRAVRGLPCWLCVEGYVGPGHDPSAGPLTLGAQGGPTAHHVGRHDAEGLIPGDGKAHDLYAGLGGDSTVRHFRAWLEERGLTLEAVGLRYVREYAA